MSGERERGRERGRERERERVLSLTLTLTLTRCHPSSGALSVILGVIRHLSAALVQAYLTRITRVHPRTSI